MRKNITLRFLLIALAAVLGFLFINSISKPTTRPAKESLEECCKNQCKMQDGDMMMGTFSRGADLYLQVTGNKPIVSTFPSWLHLSI